MTIDELTKKYQTKYGIDASKPKVQTVATKPLTASTGNSGVDSLLQKTQTRLHQQAFDAGTAATEDSINKTLHPGFFGTIKDTVKALPGAVKDLVTHPKEVVHGVAGGILDLGPSLVNGLAGIFQIKARLPKPGETILNYIGDDSDVSKAVSQATKTTGAYELGGAVSKFIPIVNRSAAATRIFGNVIGGQSIAEPDSSLADRGKQALFDAAFGAATEAGGAIVRKIVNRTRVPSEVNSALPEGPIIEETAGNPFLKKEAPKTIIQTKKLGTNPETGAKIYAQHDFDTKTGNSIIYEDPALKKIDSNPKLAAQFRTALNLPEGTNIRQFVIDHESGHIIDKRLNAGNRLSSELPNFEGNQTNLNSVLSNYAAKVNKSVEEVVTNMQKDIETLAGDRGGNPGEQFAEAFSRVRQNPVEARLKAPEFVNFLEKGEVLPPRFIEAAPTTFDTLAKSRKVTAERPIDLETTISKDEVPATRSSRTAGGKIASTKLDTGKRVTGRSSFNPEKINSSADLEILLNKVDAQSNNASANRISKSNQDIRDLSSLVGISEKDLLKARPGSIVNAETLHASRQVVMNAADDLSQTLKATDLTNAAPGELKAIRNKFLKLVALQKAVGGFRTEASNVFRALQQEIRPTENFELLLKNAEELKKLVGASDSEIDLALFAGKAAKQFEFSRSSRIGNRALATWYASILSGPKTTVRNILSTGANILTEFASRVANPAQWKELPAAVSGLFKGLSEGRIEAAEVLRGKRFAEGKFIDTGTEYTKQLKESIWGGKWKTYGAIVESVGRFLNAQDRFLAAGARGMEEASLKVASPEMTEAVSKAVARAYAESTVYHGLPKGKLLYGLREAAQSLRRNAPESKVIIPFVDTVANVLDRTFDYTPITSALRLRGSVIERQVSRIAKEFDITAESDLQAIRNRLRAQQMGRMYLGTVALGGASVLAAKGLVSGTGPKNYSERMQLQRTGWRPNSIKIGDIWVPYMYLGPLAGVFSIAGNIHDKVTYDKAPNKTVMDLAANGLVGWAQSQLNQSFLSGVASIFDVLNGGLTPATYLKNLAAGLVPIPALYSQSKDMIFRQQYETKDIVSQIRQKLGLTGDVFGMEALKPRLDAFGTPIQSDVIYGITPKKEVKSHVDNFLISNDIVVTIPSPTTQYADPKHRNQKVTLNNEEFYEYAKESGMEIYKQLNAKLPSLYRMNVDDRKKEVESISRDIRDNIRKKILRKRP